MMTDIEIAPGPSAGNAWPPPLPGEQQPPPRPREPGLDRSDLRPRPGNRPLWVLFGTVLLLAGIWWGGFSVVGLLAHEEWTVRYVESAAGVSTLRIGNSNGRVVVRGADTTEITVTAEVSRGLFATEEDARRVGDRYELTADCPGFEDLWCHVRYDIVVPREITVVVEGDNGRVGVTGLDGSVDVETDNGRIELTDISGPLRASTDNGRVVGTAISSDSVVAETDNGSIDLAFDAAPTTVDATTDNGRIEIAVPALESGYVVETNTSNGSETVEVIQNPNSLRTITAETDNGSITVAGTD